jgi:periodic tryptophan protein 2
LSQLNSKNLAEGGLIDEDGESEDDTTYNAVHIPGAKRGDDGSRKSRVEVLTSKVAFSSTGREWASVSGEGLHVYSLDDDMVFDPLFLTESITPAAIQSRLSLGEYGMALRMAVHLNERDLVKEALERTPPRSISRVIHSFGTENMERLIQFVTEEIEMSPHIEFYLDWCINLLQMHGKFLERNRPLFMRALRAMYKAIKARHDELRPVFDNMYTLDFIVNQAELLTTEGIV